MRSARWLDHLPPWLAWGSIVSTGAYAPGELWVMALPLLAAAWVEWRHGSLARWRHALEIAALAGFLLLILLRRGLLPTVVTTLFLLCAVRLCLPRGLPQRRQLLLMGFLVFLTTAVSTSELDFLLWSVVWVAGSSIVLMQLTWEKSALLRQGPLQPPPYRLALAWTAAVLVMAAGFFVILPRLHLGLRRIPVGIQAMGGLQAGLSDVVALNIPGPVLGNREVALRVLPAGSLTREQRNSYAGFLGLLRGFTLEQLEGQRWEVSPITPRRRRVQWAEPASNSRPVTADFFVEPGLMGTIPMPYGQADLDPAMGDSLRFGQGGSLRWVFPVRRATAVRIALAPSELEPEPPPRGQRLALLTATGTGTDCARNFSFREAPGDLPARDLAERLTARLRSGFSYTLDNPSGGAPNPLEDFLERSRSGHCEYFASALALMLRHRGVPARVANGYRLGPWIEEGGYFLVTQSEAHSWVEYYDPASAGWRVADPTPSAPGSLFDSGTFLARLARWSDTVRFRWDRDVVRFSDQDQLAGAAWAMDRLGSLASWRPGRPARVLGILGLLGALGWFGRGHGRRWLALAGARKAGPGRIRELRPLVRKAGLILPPLPQETARAWLGRMASLRPQRAAQLASLAREADAAIYGRKPGAALKAMAREEARHW